MWRRPKIRLSDGSDIDFKTFNDNSSNISYYITSNTNGWYNINMEYKEENAEDHPLIRILEIINEIFLKVNTSFMKFITYLELKIIAKRRKKSKKIKKRNKKDGTKTKN